MDPDPHALQILVDGSCFIHDGRKSGYAGYVHHPDGTMDEVIFCGYRESTINRMELSACIAALDWILAILAEIPLAPKKKTASSVVRAVPVPNTVRNI